MQLLPTRNLLSSVAASADSSKGSGASDAAGGGQAFRAALSAARQGNAARDSARTARGAT